MALNKGLKLPYVQICTWMNSDRKNCGETSYADLIYPLSLQHLMKAFRSLFYFSIAVDGTSGFCWRGHTTKIRSSQPNALLEKGKEVDGIETSNSAMNAVVDDVNKAIDKAKERKEDNATNKKVEIQKRENAETEKWCDPSG